MTMRAVNPATGQELATYEEHDAADVEARLARAVEAFAAWRERPVSQRVEPLRRLAELLRAQVDEHAARMTAEMGKPIREARAEALKCAWVCDYYAEHAARFLEPEPVETDAVQSLVRYDPLGPVLAVMPWNFPYWQVFRFLAPTLSAGNVGLLKHASNVPGSALAIEALCREAGYPEGVFQTLLIGSSKVEGVIRDRRVAAVTLTGSEPAGRAVARVAGDTIKPSLLELGGADPCIVLADADLDQAAAGALTGRMLNGGQSCIADKRFVVEAPVHDAFVAKLKEKMAALRVGDPTQETTDVGPLAAPAFVRDLLRQVERTIEQGATVELGGPEALAVPPYDGPGAFFPPTILTGVTAEMTAFREETFGPVAVVTRADDAEHAIALANDSDFGLGASLYTTLERGLALAPRIETGHVAINGIVKSDPRLPFGGVKRSGYGRELGLPGIRAFVNTKTVWGTRRGA